MAMMCNINSHVIPPNPDLNQQKELCSDIKSVSYLTVKQKKGWKKEDEMIAPRESISNNQIDLIN